MCIRDSLSTDQEKVKFYRAEIVWAHNHSLKQVALAKVLICMVSEEMIEKPTLVIAERLVLFHMLKEVVPMEEAAREKVLLQVKKDVETGRKGVQ